MNVGKASSIILIYASPLTLPEYMVNGPRATPEMQPHMPTCPPPPCTLGRKLSG